jgi:hypothetical protein
MNFVFLGQDVTLHSCISVINGSVHTNKTSVVTSFGKIDEYVLALLLSSSIAIN